MPSYLRAYFGVTYGSLASYASSGLIIFFYFLIRKKHRPLFPFILLGILYYMMSGLNFSEGLASDLIKEFIRFMIVVVCAVEVLYRTSNKDIFFILLIGALSIIINAFIFPLANANFYPTYGRYSGFYLNPNFAGSICLIGFALSYSLEKKGLRIIGQLVFTLAGILTLSRGFVVIWLIINFVSIYNNKKNIVVPLVGVIVLILVFALSSLLSLNQGRFSALQSIFYSDSKVESKTITNDSRTDTWALYTDIIMDKPFLGNGYGKMKKKTSNLPGVHNSYLLVLGEAGFIPFILMISIYAYLLVKSFRKFNTRPELFYLMCVLVLALTVGHGYFDDFYNVLMSMFVYVKLREIKRYELSHQ